ncbi:MAG: hypothetical protein PHG00_14505 [Methylococcales bacterium]|nr:hypothetical protein [Methylococcales bacterium]
MLNDSPAISYPTLKLIIVVLIALNAVIYAIVDTLTSAADALVWLVLLVLYELEANGIALTTKNKLQGIRNFLIAVIAIVFASYVFDHEWLDVVNSVLWFALIALLELEVRWPNIVFRYRQSYWLATLTVFAGLIAMVIAWFWQSAWLDVYDATLWIVAFAAIEVDIFQLLQRKQA